MKKDIKELEHENSYLKRLSEESISKLLQMDTQAMAIRHELEQKRRGFSLMAELAVTVGQGSDYEGVFISVSKRINAALNMQRTVVLVPSAEKGLFRPLILQGYPADEVKKLKSSRIEVDSDLTDPAKPVLVTGADPEERFAPVRKALGLPYFISAPVILHNDVIAILITGRLSEQMPFLPRLGTSDVETVQTVSAYLAAMLAGYRLQEAENMANYDPLTQLPNLRRTKEEMRQILTLARRGGFSSAVMFVDLDGFKAVNDSFGHATGDKVLKIIAERLVHSVRESDLVGRIGGDEFIVVLSHVGRPEDAGFVAGKIIEKITEPMDIQGQSCKISASIGIAIFPDHGNDWDSLIEAADAAMYEIKNQGKNAFGYVNKS